MNGTIEALKALYVAMGGALADTYEDIASGAPVSEYNYTPDMINAIANVATAGGTSELPAVTAADDGKILKVIDGEWGVGEDLAIVNGGE